MAASIPQRVQRLKSFLSCQVDSADEDGLHASLLGREGLLDALVTLFDECTHENLHRNKHVAAFCKKYGSTMAEVKKLRMNPSDFEVKDVIGRGHFGEVQVVREKVSGNVYAMKTLRKNETLAQPELSFFEEERDIMAKAGSPWITRLHYAFQDVHNLYLVMEFHAGGDLLSLLSRYDEIFEEKMAKFYLAEMTLALKDLHSMGYVHRDVKPENILLDYDGHVKLADFGSAARLSPDMLVSSHMPVGSPDYVSPELLTSMNSQRTISNYGVEVDWWSMGICMYEMLFGKTPFTDENGSMVVTYSNIMNYKKCLQFPKESDVSGTAMDLIRHLLCEKDSRLCFAEIKAHPFFTEIIWDGIQRSKPPFVPCLSSLDDTSNFEEFEKIRHHPTLDEFHHSRDFSGQDLPFIGFTYTKEEEDTKQQKQDHQVSLTDSESSIQNLSSVETALQTSFSHSSGTNLEVNLTVKVAELRQLRDRCRNLETSECEMKSELQKLKLELRDRDDELARVMQEKQSLGQEFDIYVTKANNLSKQVEAAVEEKKELERRAEQLIVDMQEINSEARHIEDELIRAQLDELQDLVVQLESEKERLMRKLAKRDMQLDTCKDQLAVTQKQLTDLQARLDKDRRKSRDIQKRELTLLETREDMWQSQTEEKNIELRALNKRVQELEDLVEAYELQEKEFTEREQLLRDQVGQGSGQDKVELRVLLQTTPTRQKDSDTIAKLKELEEIVEEKHSEVKKWEHKEEELKDVIEKLKSDLESRKQQERLTVQTKENLTHQVQLYQQEVTEQREKIKNLQESVKTYLAEEDHSDQQRMLEKKVKELESEVDMLREEKRRLFRDANKHQQEAEEKGFKVSEQERTITRLTSKLERVERQLTESREREIDLKLQRRERSDYRTKLAEERLSELRQENHALDTKVRSLEEEARKNNLAEGRLSGLREEKVALETKVGSLEKELEKLQTENKGKVEQAAVLQELKDDKNNLGAKVTDLQKEIERLRTQLTDSEAKAQNVIVTGKIQVEKEKLQKELENLQKDLERKTSESEEWEQEVKECKDEINQLQKEIAEMKEEKSILNSKISNLEKDLEHGKALNEIKEDKNSLKTKVSVLERELGEVKNSTARKWSRLEDTEDLRQEKRFLESKVNRLEKQLEESQGKAKSLQEDLKAIKRDSVSNGTLLGEVESLKQERTTLKQKLTDFERRAEQEQIQRTGGAQDVDRKERKLQEERGRFDKSVLELRRELQDANLALSEARSLVAATQRQEKETREMLDQEIRELQLRLHRAESEKGSVEEKWNSSCKERQTANQELEQELKLTKSQNEKLTRQYKDLEDRLSAIQRERSAHVMEKQMLKDSLTQKDHQIDLEVQKVEKLRAICVDLEGQIRDLETLSEEYEKQQSHWGEIKRTYEVAVDEKEEEIQGASEQLQNLQHAQKSASDRVQLMKQQLQSTKSSHKAEMDAVNHQLWEAQKELQKRNNQLADVEEMNSKLQMIVESQKKTLEEDIEEKRKLKEEISKTMTESQDVKTQNLKLKQNLDEAMDKFELIFGEKVDLENFAEALQGLQFLEKYKYESTIGQTMKLIDYLQVLWAESMDKKKKKSGKRFGTVKGKDSTSPMGLLPIQYGDLQSALELERKRCGKLQEQNERMRQENFQQANELLKLKGPLKEKLPADTQLTPNIQAAAAMLVHSPASQSKSVSLLTPSTKRSTQVSHAPTPQPHPTPQRMHHNIPHRFVSGLNTRATKCGVCLGSVPFVKQASKCQECQMVCHPKCVASVQATCGLPTEYIRHFRNIMNNLTKPPMSSSRYSPNSEVCAIKLQGWIKIPRVGKLGWECRWATLEDNILLLFLKDTDANPVDTFDLTPAETEVTVHSAVSAAELPNTASTDLSYVLRIEQEPLTTCWPGRILYMMAVNFSDKQKWVASLEAALKNLQQDSTVRRSKLQTFTLLELSGSRRMELNCSLVLSNELTLLGAEEGLYAVNIHKGKHALITKLSGFDSVHQLRYASGVGHVILITGRERRLLSVDKKLIKLRLGQATSDQTDPVPHESIDKVHGCTVFDVGVWQDSAYLCLGMSDRIVLYKYNTELRQFCLRKEFLSPEPCSCICLAEHLAVVGTDKFYQINLEHPEISEFVDKRDNSLAFAAFGAANHNSFPLAVVQVSPKGLPLEFLLCFHEFGVFVDSKGRRSRPGDMKWSCLPLSFAYSEPFLYVTYFSSVQAITVPASKTETRGKQTSLDIPTPRFLGKALTSGSVYVASSTGQVTEMVRLKGNDGNTIELYEENKENRSSSVRSGKSQSKFVSPSNPSNSQSHLRRRLSLTSLDSNSSAVSSSTVSSYDDRASLESDV